RASRRISRLTRGRRLAQCGPCRHVVRHLGRHSRIVVALGDRRRRHCRLWLLSLSEIPLELRRRTRSREFFFEEPIPGLASYLREDEERKIISPQCAAMTRTAMIRGARAIVIPVGILFALSAVSAAERTISRHDPEVQQYAPTDDTGSARSACTKN